MVGGGPKEGAGDELNREGVDVLGVVKEKGVEFEALAPKPLKPANLGVTVVGL